MNPLGTEPVYEGHPLSYWAKMTLGHGSNAQPTPEALEAMEAVRALGPVTLPYLLKWLRPPYKAPLLASGAARAFKALGAQAAPALPELTKLLNEFKPPHSGDIYANDYTAWRNVCEALSALGPEALPVLLGAATDIQGQDVQWELIQGLGDFGADGTAAIPALIAWTHDKNSWVRLGAVNALGRIAQDPQAVIPVLLKALKDPDVLVRRDAGRALGRFGKAAREAVPDLIQALDDSDWHAQPGAILGLGRISEQQEIVLPLLIKKLHDGNRIVRRSAAFALGDIGGQAAFDALMEATDDPDGSAREAVFQSLKKINPEALQKSGKRFY